MPEHAWICRISRGPPIIDSEAEAVSAAQDMAFKQTCGRAKRFASVSQRRVDQKIGAIVWPLHLLTILLLHLLANWKNLCLRWKMASDGIGVSALRVTLRLPIPEVLKQILGANSANCANPETWGNFWVRLRNRPWARLCQALPALQWAVWFIFVFISLTWSIFCVLMALALCFGKLNPIQNQLRKEPHGHGSDKAIWYPDVPWQHGQHLHRLFWHVLKHDNLQSFG